MSENDAVNHPGHYTSHPSGVECIQITEHMSFCLGNAIKYIWRADLKGNAIEDLRKARWYVDREIARLGGEPAVLDEPVAARLEAESARDEEAEKLAKLHRGVLSDSVYTRWEDLDTTARDLSVAAMRAVLDRLAADGRLLPEGGTVLTEEQVANLRWLMAQYVGSDGDINSPPYASLDALFTPPAAPVPDSGPDGTPEKPWPNLHAVPVPVREVRDRHGLRWGRHSDTEWRGCDWSSACAAGHPEDAPFVRVDGDK